MRAHARVKICGITSLADAHAAIDAGADALGFVCAPESPRWIEPDLAAAIAQQLPPFIARVGVFVDAPAPLVRELAEHCAFDTLQFHGAESPDYCAGFAPWKVVKAFRVRDASSLADLDLYPTDAWLLDSLVPGVRGGSGAKFNWDLAGDAKRFARPIILAGGLRPENVVDAIRLVRPYAVDVSSGVESAPGKKDTAKLRAFVSAAKQFQWTRPKAAID